MIVLVSPDIESTVEHGLVKRVVRRLAHELTDDVITVTFTDMAVGDPRFRAERYRRLGHVA